jgi:hypothetical protein
MLNAHPPIIRITPARSPTRMARVTLYLWVRQFRVQASFSAPPRARPFSVGWVERVRFCRAARAAPPADRGLWTMTRGRPQKGKRDDRR